MHPLLKHLRGLAALLLAALLVALAPAAAWRGAAPGEWAWALAFWWPVALLAAMTALSTYYVCRGCPLQPARWARALGQRSGAVLALALLMTAAGALWNQTGALAGRSALVPALTPVAWAGFLGVQLLLFTMAVLAHDALLSHQAAQAAAATEAQARLLAREMEIRALRHQIEPHFLFNCLNSISALTQLDAAGARAMTLDLAQFFRQTLALGAREHVTLAEDLALVHSYLAIERRRLGDRLGLTVQADDAALQARVPPLLLQPLVENAIKHGIRLLDGGGVIELVARCRPTRLELSVSNPVAADAPADASGLGQGLQTLSERLRLLYAEPAGVAVERGPQRHTVRIFVPWQP